MSIENDIEEHKKRLELLKLARHMVNDQYLKDRASAYVQWSTDSDRVWKEQGKKLLFPAAPSMPSEADVVAKALDLYNHINAPKQQETVAPATITVTEEPATANLVLNDTLLKPQPMIQQLISSATVTESWVPEPVSNIVTEKLVEKTIEPEKQVVTETTVDPILPVPQEVVGMTAAETAIKEIFNTPAVDPVLVPANTPRSESVIPLIKSMLKKGLLPSWIKADTLDEDTK